MNRSTPELLTRWLAAEDDLDDEAAEAALAALAAELPDRSPSPGFAARVMTGVRAEAKPQGAFARRWARASVLGGIALSGLAALWLVPLVWWLAPRPSAPGSVSLAAGLVRRLGEGLAALAAWADAFGAMRRALTGPFDHPTVLASLAILVTVAYGALILLQTLIRRERSWSYVDL
ncbi:MAG TPA: hypothetical protein VN851_13800 [Thermoanaerobaculia bacterium]|nr:hypothetical protein [Thermoanaerobaculia bacterium]